jgi:hypothetical protein
VAPVIRRWRADQNAGYRSLRYRRGPGFLLINDRRPNLEAADYSFGEAEAAIYLACDDGATAADALAAVQAQGIETFDLEEVTEFLDGLVDSKLAYREGGRYLSLALSMTLLESTT